jgi:hypothetical protein
VNKIGLEGSIKLSEALKSNCSLILLNLSDEFSLNTKLVASFHFKSIQGMILVLKEQSQL